MKKYLQVALVLFSVFILSINGINFSAIFIIASLWIIYLAFILRNISKKSNKRWINILSNIYQTLVILFISSFLIIEILFIININQFKEVENIEKVDYVLVLGAGLDGNKVGKILKSRLDKAIEYYKLHNDVDIIVSGGLGKNKSITEAQAMYTYLIENGVNKDKIIKEDKATTTLENIKFSQKILNERGDEDKKVLIVTNEFHLYRSMVIADILGMNNEGLACKTKLKIRVNYMIREYPTFIIDVVKSSMYILMSS